MNQFNVKLHLSIIIYYIAPLIINLFVTQKLLIFEIIIIIDRMIQVANCQLCNAAYPIEEIKVHESQCRATEESSDGSKKSIKVPKWEKVSFHAQLIKQYCHIEALKNQINRQIKAIINQKFGKQVNDYRLTISADSCYINFELSPKLGIQSYVLEQLEDELQEYFNSYDIISFHLDEDHQKNLDLLKNKYIFQVLKSQIIFISKKSQILYNVTKFFQSVTSLTKINKKFAICSEVLQFELERAKQVQQAIKSIYLLIVSPDQVSIKQRNDRVCFVFISGQQQTVSICKDHITNIVAQDSFEHCCKRYKITQQQAKLLQKNKILQKITQQYGAKFQLKTFNIVREHKINKNSKIQLLVNSSILSLPRQTVIILPRKQIKEIKQLHDSTQIFKDYLLYDSEEDKPTQDIVKQFIQLYAVQGVEIGVALPDATRQAFIQSILNVISSSGKAINLYLLERVDERLAVQAFESIVSMEKKWYATVRGEKKYYPPLVCSKIQQALANSVQSIVVTNKELDIKKITHKYDGSQSINHISTGNSNFVQDQQNKLVAFVGDHIFQIDKKTIIGSLLTFAAFEISLFDKTQTNLITHSRYNINYQMAKKEKNEDDFDIQKPSIQVTIKYPDQQEINHIWNSIKSSLASYRVFKTISIQNFTQTQLKEIKNWCNLNKVEIKVQDKEIEVQSYSKTSIANLQKLIQIHAKKLQAPKIEYPPYWEHDLPEIVSLRTVDKNSEEFVKVQDKFKVGHIKKLERVQNNILFEKYNSERAYLRQINGGTIRQLMLYHGTRTNKPQAIYGDLDESFNINYANAGSFGKGIYFAKNSEYSNNYCYISHKDKQMFYCLVLAGNSQVFRGGNKLDTSYRDAARKIRYESVVDSAGESIVVVFKNRRAYPLYLITY